jgi:alpha-beta hydrolase superfamily lysophospholipase
MRGLTRRLLLILGFVAALVVVGAGIIVALVRARGDRLERALAPFYVPPDPLPAGRPGDLIRWETLDAPAGVRAWRVLYHSTTFEGAPAAVSGLIAVPDRPPPPGGFPVVGVAHGTVGTARICAPSLEPFRSRSALPDFLTAREIREQTDFNLFVKPFTDAGFAVTMTDYRGLGTPGPSPYLVGEDEARNVLDSIRAIRRFPEATTSDQTLVWGQSQGGHSAAFTGQLAERYAPELRILGIVLGAPAAELGLLSDEIARVTTRSPLAGLFATIVRAWSATYPGLSPEDVLTPRGLRQLDTVDEKCIVGVLLAYNARPAPEYIKADGIRSAPWQEQLARNTPGQTRTPAPILLFQGGADQIISPASTEAFLKRLCAAGNTVDYRVYPELGHIDSILPTMPDSIAWMADRLAGRPAPQSC